MSDVVIKVSPIRGNISPLGFYCYAIEFPRATPRVKSDDPFSPVPYYLICHSIELALNAFLLARGVPIETKNAGKND